MKAIKKSTGQVIEVTEWSYGSKKIYTEDDMPVFYTADELDFTLSEPEEEVRIDGYVARNKDGDIHIFNNKPYRDGISDGGDFWFSPNGGSHFELPEDAFSHITWLSEPQRVVLTIKPKKK